MRIPWETPNICQKREIRHQAAVIKNSDPIQKISKRKRKNIEKAKSKANSEKNTYNYGTNTSKNYSANRYKLQQIVEMYAS